MTKTSALMPWVIACLGLPAMAAQGPPERLSISVNKADLKDMLRALTTGTDFNLIFEPGLETQTQGLNLKDMTLQEILDEILPHLGLACTRQGRNLHIRKSAGELRYYPVEHLSMARNGAKSFQVNASGQVIQSLPGGGGSSGTSNTSAYTSSLKGAQLNDLWADLESALALLVFGKPTELKGTASQSEGPSSRGAAADGKSLLIQPSPGLVMVVADALTHERVEGYLRQMRKRTERQVLLEARIVEVALMNEHEVGVNWTTLLNDGGTISPFNLFPNGMMRLVAQSGRVQATLNALAQDHRLKVLSAPRIATLNNQKAILRVVREEAYAIPSSQIAPGAAGGQAVATVQINTMMVPVGIVLDIQPQVGDDGIITLAVNPSVSELAGSKEFSLPDPKGGAPLTATLPVVNRRDLDTIVRIRSGETLVLAGMIRSRENAGNSGVPWLRRIPLLGGLFSKTKKERDRTELAIFITPTLMEDATQVEAERKGAEDRLEGAGAVLRPPPPAPGERLP